ALTVDSLNGVRNRAVNSSGVREADPEFVKALQLLRDVQAAGAMGMRVEEEKDKGQNGVIFFRRDDVAPEIRAKALEIRRLLNMPAEGDRFTLVYSPMHGASNELAVNSRSMLQIMAAFSTYMEVPEAHLKSRSASPAFENAGTNA